MLLDRGLLEQDGDTYRPTAAPLARRPRDAARPGRGAPRRHSAEPERRLLQNAAVLGKTFSAGGLAAWPSSHETALDPALSSPRPQEILAVHADPRSPERRPVRLPAGPRPPRRLRDTLKPRASARATSPRRPTSPTSSPSTRTRSPRCLASHYRRRRRSRSRAPTMQPRSRPRAGGLPPGRRPRTNRSRPAATPCRATSTQAAAAHRRRTARARCPPRARRSDGIRR